jgi:hypothetical protein
LMKRYSIWLTLGIEWNGGWNKAWRVKLRLKYRVTLHIYLYVWVNPFAYPKFVQNPNRNFNLCTE